MVATITVVKYPRTDRRLGRCVEHDSRSWDFQARSVKKPPDIDVIWEDRAPVLDQWNLGGCVGWTGADILNTEIFKPVRDKCNAGAYFNDFNGKTFYHLSTVNDSIVGIYPPDDTGSSGLGLAKALKKVGYVTSYNHVFAWNSYLTWIAKQPLAVGTL